MSYKGFCKVETPNPGISLGVLDFDYNMWTAADSTWAPMILFGVIFSLILVALNVFIAILCESFTVRGCPAFTDESRAAHGGFHPSRNLSTEWHRRR